ncbi:ribosome rescue GTPase HflX [Rhodanobacter sp. DHB23]|uniref:ribosome rescue GTPase HflX n=1 Tax=Rhodanobacter sp. DHB23 TaxID=2775923 RepID=UPI00177B1B1B|nr:GTPase HflX [Rhodanobacter sp. DHB23]
MFDRQKKGERAVLVLPHARGSGDAERRAAEFAELVKSAGAEVLGSISARVEVPNPRFYIGSGKADEVAEMVRALEADLVLVDHLLSPVQERNLEKHLSARVVDRAGLILDIFAQRARSHEGKLEVELAQLKHVATRLVRGWTHLDAQRGGAIGNRGPGETQLETDRRLLAERVKQLTKRLEKVQTQRGQQRRARLRNTVPRVALVGYTNAGKSTLFNTLTAGGVYAADQLFATLDPTVRRLDDLACGPAVIADTVGFIRELPHDLVAAFRGTLAEARDADLLLHVSDAADEEREPLRRVVDQVLEEIGAGDVPQLRVFNKIDLMGSTGAGGDASAGVPAGEDQAGAAPDVAARETAMQPRIDRDAEGKPQAVWLSAATGAGIELLRQALGELLGGERVQSELRLPLTAGRLHARLKAAGAIAGEQVDEHGWCLRIDAPRSVIAPLNGGSTAENELLRGLLAGVAS